MDPKALAVLTENVAAQVKANDLADEIEFVVLISVGHNTCIKRFCSPDRLLHYSDVLMKQRHSPPQAPGIMN